jgi:GntR family transcriptional regulator
VNSSAKFQVKPLYLQVRDAVLDRIKSGKLRSGGLLPSELDLHRELGVSLGTLRKALGVLEAERLIVRKPGRGTFVWSREMSRECERFNPIRGSDGEPLRGRINTGKAKLGTPRARERAALMLKAGDQVVRFERLRCLEGRPYAYELVCLPAHRFPNLMLRSPPPDDLEELALISGIVVARAEGKARALAVPPTVAAALSVAQGTIALCLERIAFDTDDRPVEVMTAYYDLKNEYCGLMMR